MRVTVPNAEMFSFPVESLGFLDGFKRALTKAGCEVREFVRPPKENTSIHTRWATIWEDGGKSAWVCVDWSDETLPRYNAARRVDDVVFEDAISAYFKMKLCDRHADYYQRWQTFPGGYFLAPGRDADGTKALWYLDNLERLRAVKDTEKQRPGVYTRGAYREKVRCPARTNLWAADLYQGECDYANFASHLEHVARSKSVLSLSGPHMTIDRKVMECFGIGVAMISDRGLEDLQLPYGRRIRHEEHVLYVDSVKELRAAVRRLNEDHVLRRRLELNSRVLFDECFEEASLGRWYVETVMEAMG